MNSMGGDVESGEKTECTLWLISATKSSRVNLHLSQCNVELNGLPCFSARREASLLYTTVAMVPIPPAAEKTSGEN